LPVGEEYQAVKIGQTPDGEWTWYMVCTWGHGAKTDEASILGIVAESSEQTKFWREDTYRYYKVFVYDQGHYGGTIAFTSANTLDDAVRMLRARYMPDWESDRE
jgi:hypothetical protein